MPPEPISSSIRYLPLSLVPITVAMDMFRLGESAVAADGIFRRHGHGCVPHGPGVPLVLGIRARDQEAHGGVRGGARMDLHHGRSGPKPRTRTGGARRSDRA